MALKYCKPTHGCSMAQCRSAQMNIHNALDRSRVLPCHFHGLRSGYNQSGRWWLWVVPNAKCQRVLVLAVCLLVIEKWSGFDGVLNLWLLPHLKLRSMSIYLFIYLRINMLFFDGFLLLVVDKHSKLRLTFSQSLALRAVLVKMFKLNYWFLNSRTVWRKLRKRL